MGTHVVVNQPRPLIDYDVFGCDTSLVDAVQRYGGAASLPRLHTLGRLAGSAQASQWATQGIGGAGPARDARRWLSRVVPG